MSRWTPTTRGFSPAFRAARFRLRHGGSYPFKRTFSRRWGYHYRHSPATRDSYSFRITVAVKAVRIFAVLVVA